MTARKIDIKVVSGVSAGDIFHFTVSEDKPLLIGRDPSCSIVLQDAYVSRRHACISVRSGVLWIADEGSSHGTVHMGFQLQPGEAGARVLNTGDEFKIGDTIFSIRFEISQEPAKEKERKPRPPAAGLPAGGLRNRRYMIYGLLLTVLLLLLLLPSGNEHELPAQNDKLMSLPEYGVKGYWPGSPGDETHLDRARFVLPASDLVLEYEYLTEASIEVLLDDVVVDRLKTSAELWQKRQMVVRDVAMGKDRLLNFNNTEYPPSGKQQPAPWKRWKVRNLRLTHLGARNTGSLDSAVAEAVSLASRIDTTPESLFTLVRALQKCIAEAVSEAGLDAAAYPIDLEKPLEPKYVKADEFAQGGGQSMVLSAEAINEDLNQVQQRRQQGLAAQFSQQQISDFTDLTAKLDTELWRRVNSRILAASREAQDADYIAAHDHLQAVVNMIPDENDLRRVMAERRLHDEKIVPKKVRANPSKYRKEAH